MRSFAFLFDQIGTEDMDSGLSISNFDVDGAVAETHAAAVEQLERNGDTRAGFLRKIGLAGGAAMGGGALLGALAPASALALGGGAPPAAFGAGDVGILNYALTLEYLESTFYSEAAKHLYGSATPRVKAFIKTTNEDEAAHVKALQGALGSAAVKKPKFNFGPAVTNMTTFKATAFVLENTGVHAYAGQAFNIKTPSTLAVALSIITVEARHAGAIASITGKQIAASGPFDTPYTAAQVLAAVKGTGFIVG